MARVDQFIEHIRKYGISTKSRFDVSIPFPQALVKAITDSGSGALLNQFDPSGTLRAATDALNVTDGRGPLNLARQLSMVCIGARIPGMNINTIEWAQTGHNHKIATGSNSEDAEFIFIVSRDGSERSIFEKWINMICDFQTGKVGYYDDYVTESIRISPKDNQDTVQHYIDLMEAYPITVNAIDLDRTSTNEYQVISVAFTFKRLRPKGSQGFMDQVMESKAGQVVSSIASGDFAGAAQHARDVAIAVSQGEYAGEALGAFGMIQSASEMIGINPKATQKVLNTMKIDVAANARISSDDKSKLSGLIDKITGN